MNKVRDYRHHFHGYWRPGGVCQVAVYTQDDAPPVFVVTELDENTNTSITNLVEYLAAEIVRDICPQAFEDTRAEPFVWIECYPHEGIRSGEATYDRVTFDSYRLRQEWRYAPPGQRRLRIGEPSWRRISAEEVSALLGDDQATSDVA